MVGSIDSISGDGRVQRPVVDSADAVTFGDGDLDVTVDAPVGAPGVAHVPVLKTGILVRPVPNDRHGMVCADATILRVENTTRVVVEDVRASIYGNGDGLLGDRNLHLSWGLWVHADVSVEGDAAGLALLVGASAIRGGVGPVSLKIGVVAH